MLKLFLLCRNMRPTTPLILFVYFLRESTSPQLCEQHFNMLVKPNLHMGGFIERIIMIQF